jgi:hypothetical protein
MVRKRKKRKRRNHVRKARRKAKYHKLSKY